MKIFIPNWLLYFSTVLITMGICQYIVQTWSYNLGFHEGYNNGYAEGWYEGKNENFKARENDKLINNDSFCKGKINELYRIF